MTADEVIESYVRDVALYLPRAKRNDVAFELRLLLEDELAERTAGEAPIPDAAVELLNDFGRPAEVARRYHEPPAVIDQSDTHHFVVWSVAGALVIGILASLSLNWESGGDLLLRWLGVLVIVFAILGWWRRQRGGGIRWKPKRGPDSMPRGAALLAAAATLVFPVFMYAAPQTFVQVVFLGAVPTGGLELTETFHGSWQRAATLALLIASAAIYSAVAWQGRWQRWTRWPATVIQIALAVLFIMHAAPLMSPAGAMFTIFKSADANTVAMPILGGVGAIFVLGALYELYREWARVRPAPALPKGKAS